LVKLYSWGSKNKFDSDQFYDMKNTHTGLTKAKIREWLQMAKQTGPETDAFLNHDDKDLTPYTHGADGKKSVNPEYQKHLGRAPQGHEFDHVKRHLSTQRWKDNVGKAKKGGGDKPQPQAPDKPGVGGKDGDK
jgi:hypothetical protein